MSFIDEGRKVRCDGDGCQEQTSLPVALHVTLSSAEGPSSAQADGWLFLIRAGQCRHYCPRCASHILTSLTQDLL